MSLDSQWVPGEPFSIEWATPKTPSCNVAYLLDTQSFRVALKTTSTHSKPDDFHVYIWTNLYHKDNCDGDWHAVPAIYEGAQQHLEDSVIFLYGVELVISCLGVYRCTFKAKHKYHEDFKWAERFLVDAVIDVRLPVKDYTTWIQEPKRNQITHNIYIGNLTAAMELCDKDFDCLLNMANDVHVYPEQFTKPIIYKKCPLPYGVDYPISREIIETMVNWLRYMSNHCKKVLVFSRTGHARSGSIIVAYIYYMNPDLSFREAFDFVDRRSFVCCHKGLEDAVVSLYPRS